MEQVINGDECFSVGAEDIIEHSEEVVTSNSTEVLQRPVEVQAVNLPQTFQIQTPIQAVPHVQHLHIPTVITSPGPIMQVVTLHQPSQPVALTSTLRNIRLIQIQPKSSPFNGSVSNGISRPQTLTSAQTVVTRPSPQVIRPKPEGIEQRKLSVGSFYSKVNASPVTKIAVERKSQPAAPVEKFKPSPSFYKEQQRQRELAEYSHLSEELQKGMRILLDILSSLHNSTTAPFMEEVDAVRDGAPDYYKVIDKSMWINKIKDKFKANEYQGIEQFVQDFRQLLENCYKYNGPAHPVTKKGLRLEQTLEQKLSLLPSDLREKCSLATCYGPEILQVDPEIVQARPRKPGPVTTEPFFSYLLHKVRDDRKNREEAARKAREEAQRKRKEEKDRQRCLWAEQIMNPQIKSQMRLMWEIPQIGHFLHLAQKALHIGEIAQFELEHMFLMPQPSVLLATLMTSLLSSPNQRVKLAEAPPTPYATWANRLSARVAEWYRTYNREMRQVVKLHELLGLESMFWRVCGDRNPLEGGRMYHELSFLKRIWIFKGLCDTVYHTHKTVQEVMAEELEGPDAREVILGQDGQGFTYLHFPAVSGSDIRVYRQKPWDLTADPIWGPLVAERDREEELRVMEEEAKQQAKNKKAASSARKPTPAKKTPAKKQPAPRSAAKTATPPASKKRKVEERPQRIGTRVSPRTLQRQTGLTSYADSFSEEESEGSALSEVEKSASEEDDDDEAQEEEPRPRTPARKRMTVRATRRSARQKLEQIPEEETEAMEEVSSDVPEAPEVKKEAEVKEEPPEIKETVEDREGTPVESEAKEDLVKVETPDAESKDSDTCKQKLTVSQLLKLQEDQERPAEEESVEEKSEVKTEEPVEDTDPERSSYDPFYFELVICNVEELKEWIANFSDPEDGLKDRKPRPRCEAKLRERLQALLEEAEPLAQDQLQANEKICRQLWKQWDHYHTRSASGEKQGVDSDHGTEGSGSEDEEEAEEEAEEEEHSEESDDGLRHSKRLRKRKQIVASEQSTRSSSPVDERQARKSSYNFDPEWGSDEEKPPPAKKTPVFSEEMKNPHYWIGRRITRAAAAFVPSEDSLPDEKSTEESSQEVSSAEPKKDEPPATSTTPEHSGGELIDQLRQLRRQQVQLSSHDPPESNGTAKTVKITSEKAAEMLRKIRLNTPTSSPGGLPSAGGTVRIRAPTILKPLPSGGQQAPSTPASIKTAPAADASTVSIDITPLVNRAAEQGLIVTHEPRYLSMDLGDHGHYLVSAQMTPAGPKVLSAVPATVKSKSSNGILRETVPLNGSAPPSGPTVQNQPEESNGVATDLLSSIVGPEAAGAKLIVVREGTSKVLQLVLSSGEVRKLTTAQVAQIQNAIRKKTSGTT